MSQLLQTTSANESVTHKKPAEASSGVGGNKVYDLITERVVALLEQGTVPWRKPWASNGMPRNFRSQKTYRGINLFLLSCTPYGAAEWVTFNQARDLGGMVRKGEKGFPVVFWRWLEKEDENGKKSNIPLLRYYTVFNVEQCDGLPASGQAVERPFSPIEAAEQIVSLMPNAPKLEHNAGAAYYRPATDTVSVPRPTLFASSEDYYSTIFHELGHATGHASRLARPGVTDAQAFGSHEYSKEELVAEMTAAFLCGHCGIEQKTLDNSAAYLASWLGKLRSDSRLVVSAAAQAQRAADLILNVNHEAEAEAGE